jgi:hypothetical protein
MPDYAAIFTMLAATPVPHYFDDYHMPLAILRHAAIFAISPFITPPRQFSSPCC